MFPVAAEEGVQSGFRWSVEHGVFGGRPISATHLNPTAITSPGWLLDFYNGGGLDQSFLAMGEIVDIADPGLDDLLSIVYTSGTTG